MKLETPELLRADGDVYPKLREMAQTAERHLLFSTMSLDDAGDMQDLLGDVCNAASRGVKSEIIYDQPFSRFDVFTKRGLVGITTYNQWIMDLENSGVKLTNQGQNKLNPFAGKFHSKMYIADNDTLLAGGVNLVGDSAKHNDYMLHYQNTGLAEILSREVPEIAASRNNAIISINDDNQLLMDGGKPGDSLIHQKALEMVEGASRAWYISKMLPTAKLAMALNKVDDLQAWHTRVDSGGKLNRLSVALDSKKVNLGNKYIGNKTLHAKYIVAEYPGGERRAITGSHNFNWRGIKYGTQEMALDTKDQYVCQKLIDYTDELNS